MSESQLTGADKTALRALAYRASDFVCYFEREVLPVTIIGFLQQLDKLRRALAELPPGWDKRIFDSADEGRK